MARSTRTSVAGQVAAVARRAVGRVSGTPEEPATPDAGEASATKAAPTKAAPKKAPAKKAPAKRAAAKKAPAKKAAAKKAPAEKAAAATGTKASAGQASGGPAVGKKPEPTSTAATKKAGARKASTTSSAAPATPAKATPVKTTAAKTSPAKTATKAPATKAVTKKAPAKKAPAKKAPAKAAKSAASTAAAAPVGDLAVKAGEEAWTKAELKEVLAELHEQRDHSVAILVQQESELSGLMRDSGDGAGHDQADMGATSFERDHELTVLNIEREKVAQIDRALTHIEDGTYGVCESCGNAIGKMRVMAFPRATLCLTCKQREERR